MNVAVITDSTACIPAELADQWQIGVVDVRLRLGERIDDERRFERGAIIEALRTGQHVSTAPPEPGAFFWTYQDAVSRGAQAIVSLHISAKMSATAESAREAAAQVRVPVHVVDSGTTGMSLGFAALTAARTAAAGGDAGRVVESARRRCATGRELVYVDTLEYLRRGGRIGAASALLGTALSIKPVLTVSEGEVAPLARVPGTKRALAKLADLAVEYAGERPVDIAIASATPGEREQALEAELARRLPAPQQVVRVSASTVISAHVGPNALGITVAA